MLRIPDIRRRSLVTTGVLVICLAVGGGLALFHAVPGQAGGVGDAQAQAKRALLDRWNRPPAADSSNVAPDAVTPTARVLPADQGDILTCNPNGCGGGQLIFSSAIFNPTTQYTYDNGRQVLVVWGGADGVDSGKGGMRVEITSDSDGSEQSGSGTFYPTADLGPLTITAASQSAVSFSYPGGKGVFSLASDAFTLTPATG